jgi:hypothetical protein
MGNHDEFDLDVRFANGGSPEDPSQPPESGGESNDPDQICIIPDSNNPDQICLVPQTMPTDPNCILISPTSPGQPTCDTCPDLVTCVSCPEQTCVCIPVDPDRFPSPEE